MRPAGRERSGPIPKSRLAAGDDGGQQGAVTDLRPVDHRGPSCDVEGWLSSHDADRLVVNDDGSVDIYLGPQQSDGVEQNWIPTVGHDFWLLFRFYGPTQALFDQTWTADDVIQVHEGQFDRTRST